MPHIAYVNGQYINHADAVVHVEDRGYQFADGAYEYIAFYNKRMLDANRHVERFRRSLQALSIDASACDFLLPVVMRELIDQNRRDDGAIYLQITRGVAKRDHPFPQQVKPSVVATIWGSKAPTMEAAMKGCDVITYKDNRWERCDIKSVALLANVLAKQEATRKQAREAWLFKQDGMITEGAVSNAYIISRDGGLVTHPKTYAILGGVTRDVVLSIAGEQGVKVEERPFNLHEVGSAAEAFLTSTSSNIMPVVRVDGKPIGDGTPGKITLQLLKAYHEHVFRQTGKRW